MAVRRFAVSTYRDFYRLNCTLVVAVIAGVFCLDLVASDPGVEFA